MFSADLKQYGPEAPPSKPPRPAEARRYCRRLATRHYENFTVASLLLPRRLRQHFFNVYAYCRWADDLGDDTGDRQQSLALLQWWESQLHDCYAGRTTHPVFVALIETIRQFDIPADPFLDLLVAFRRDQQVTRYESFGQLLDYCRYSANPVGRLVLHLGKCCTGDLARLADSICTGLQLANFWQDVARDFDIGRIYLPQADCRRFGYTESDFAARRCNDAFRRLLAEEVARAEQWLRRGLPLVDLVPRELRLEVAVFVQGGLAVLDAIRRRGYDVWTYHPEVSKLNKVRLLAKCWWRLRRGTHTGGKP